jgi:hypothetical protein
MMRVKTICAGLFSLGVYLGGQTLCQGQETTLVSSDRVAETRSDEKGRNVEADLQQAWLSDPITFPYYLEAQMVGSKLELRGYVPNRRVHDQALKHAFEHATTNILDAIRELPGVEVRIAAIPADQLQALAVQTLQRTFGNEMNQVRIEAKSGGGLILLGVAATPEQKRWAALSLRHVPGCTSIINHIEVATVTPATARNQAARDDNSGAEVIVITPMKGSTTSSRSTTPQRPEAAPPRAWVPPEIPAVPLPKNDAPSSRTSSSASPVAPTRAEIPPTGAGVRQVTHSELPVQTSHLVPALKRRFPGVLRINVQHQDNNRVRIDLWVNTAAEGHRLISELDRMEELAPYYCETHIHHN